MASAASSFAGRSLLGSSTSSSRQQVGAGRASPRYTRAAATRCKPPPARCTRGPLTPHLLPMPQGRRNGAAAPSQATRKVRRRRAATAARGALRGAFRHTERARAPLHPWGLGPWG